MKNVTFPPLEIICYLSCCSDGLKIEDVAPLDKLVVACVDKLDDWITERGAFVTLACF